MLLRRNYLRRRVQQANLLLGRLLVRRTAQRLSSRLTGAIRFNTDAGQRQYQAHTLSTSSSALLVASAKQEANLLFGLASDTVAPFTTAAVRRNSKAVAVRQSARSYQVRCSLTARLNKNLRTLRLLTTKYRRNSIFASQQDRLRSIYSSAKEALRARFFYRRALFGVLTNNCPQPHPTLSVTQLRNTCHYQRSCLLASLQKYKRTAAGVLQQRLQVTPRVLPLRWKLASTAKKLRLLRSVRSTRQTITPFSKHFVVAPRSFSRFPKRLKRAITATYLKDKKRRKSGQRRYPLYTTTSKVSTQRTEALS